MICLATAAWSERCTLASEDTQMVLDWSPDNNTQILVNGVAIPAQWITEPTDLDEMRSGDVTYTIHVQGPMIFANKGRASVTVVPAQLPDTVTVTSVNIPHKYTDYETATTERVVFNGACKGLF
ncbi:hypothetical protein MWU60_02565 [Yoonia sp. F2084L]|uniref:hypothetical protein n=1 Tax=Yoonia sp. F2084L TaxID=2926419 RepID=UPI001FF454BD|nr:hypothetical protein [Yoonia sp. F2084L]MCK0094441.1 hypothetical protein [Yoonia sp. F2084L]